MILGMSIETFTAIHVAISLIGIVTGLIVLKDMIQSRHSDSWAANFLAATVLTSVTGFPIPPYGFDPPRAVGTLSLVLLAPAVLALYIFNLGGVWRGIYVGTAIGALYLNCFVAVVQSFQKISFLKVMAPHQSEPPFALAQLIVLAIFIALGVLATRRFHPNVNRPAVAPR
jgi:hypothetical protein